jgi:hypothetical protein
MTSDQRSAALRCALGGLLLVASSGCRDDELPPDNVRSVITIEEVPASVLEAAKKALPGVAIQDAWKNLDRSTRALHSYEVRGRAANGKVREVRVSTEGKILEME